MNRPIVVIVGDDDALIAEALRGAVEEALGDEVLIVGPAPGVAAG